MDEKERAKKSIALIQIAARSARMAAYLYASLIMSDQGSPRTVRAREAATETIEMLQALFVTDRGSYSDAVMQMVPGRGIWLDQFEDEWNIANPEFQVTECIQVLEKFEGQKELTETEIKQSARLLLVLQDKAREEQYKYQPG